MGRDDVNVTFRHLAEFGWTRGNLGLRMVLFLDGLNSWVGSKASFWSLSSFEPLLMCNVGLNRSPQYDEQRTIVPEFGEMTRNGGWVCRNPWPERYHRGECRPPFGGRWSDHLYREGD